MERNKLAIHMKDTNKKKRFSFMDFLNVFFYIAIIAVPMYISYQKLHEYEIKLPEIFTSVVVKGDDDKCKKEIPSFSYSSSDKWIIKEYNLENQNVKIKISPIELYDEEIKYITGEYGPVGKRKDVAFEYVLEDGAYVVDLDFSQMEIGEYEIVNVISTGCFDITTTPIIVTVSYPMFVMWTHDWEGYDVKQIYLDDIDRISRKHYDIPSVHFFNPRIYITGDLSASRAQYLTDWVIERRDTLGHEIALHLHMHTDMIEHVGLEPHESPAWGWNTDDGYDVLTLGYDYDVITTLLEWSKNEFYKNGLGVPEVYRAGGWFADEGTLQALEDTGFVIDSSGRTKYHLGNGNILGPWDLPVDTQPYLPNIYNQNLSVSPTMDIWEFPNNGGDSWAFSEEEMKDRFNRNFGSGILSEPATVVYLSHPHWFYEDSSKIDGLFSYIDMHLYSEGRGPVIYATYEDIYTYITGEEK